MPMLKKITFAVSLAFCAAVNASEKPSTLADQQSVAVTIYNENLALVKDQRRIALEAGRNRLALREVSGRMRPETALLRSLSHPGSLTPARAELRLRPADARQAAGEVRRPRGAHRQDASARPAPNRSRPPPCSPRTAAWCCRIGDRIETGLPGRIVYDGVPANLRDRPTLVSELRQPRAPASRRVELSYLTGGLAWKADYVAELNAADNALDLNGWVTLTNTERHDLPERQAAAGRRRREPRARRDAPGAAQGERDARAGRGAGAADGAGGALRVPPLHARAPDHDRRQPDQAGGAARARRACRWRRSCVLQGSRLLLPLERRRHRPEDEGRRVRAVREPRGVAPGHADAEGRGARLQEGQRRQRAIRRRGPHRPHAEEREACA